MTENLHPKSNQINIKSNQIKEKRHPNPWRAASPEDLKSQAIDAGFNTLYQKILPCFNVRNPEALKKAMRAIADSPAYSKARHPKNYMIKALANEGFILQRDVSDSKPRKKLD